MWAHFTDNRDADGRAIACKHCGTTSAAHLVEHIMACSKASEGDVEHALTLQRIEGNTEGSPKKRERQLTMEDVVGSTTKEKKNELDDRVAEFYFSNGIPFHVGQRYLF
jgi:hypothetical protein